MSTAFLEVRGLTVRAGERVLVDGVDVAAERGRTLGVVGESGSGKSMLVKALTGLLPTGVTTTGAALLDGIPVNLAASERAWGRVRGRKVVLVLQDPFTSLDPLHRCGWQVMASSPTRGRAARRAEVVRRLAEVGLPARVARQYPHELSGGMRQRVAIAAALASDPQLLIADEPTTALDVTTQREILDLLASLQQARGMTLVLITHDLGLAEERCDDLVVMRAGTIVERGRAADVFADPQHPYTQALSEAARGRVRTSGERAEAPVALRASGLVKQFRGADERAVDDVTIEVRDGECVGVVGESGSGKTTVARCVVGLETPDEGTIEVRAPGADGLAATTALTPAQRARAVQIVFQDPYSALNPALTIGTMLREALDVAARGESGSGDAGRPGERRTVDELLTMVGLPTSYARRRPARLSGGERQRVAIARALAPAPRVLVCDESVSALDVSVQAQVLDLLARLRAELGLTILFISHDLGVMQQVTDRVYVMRAGKVVETGPTAQVLREPEHPYTRTLLDAVPGSPGGPAHQTTAGDEPAAASAAFSPSAAEADADKGATPDSASPTAAEVPGD
ncbi:peptide/nickel transport system ATP-binding protein [Flavimobilis soli]|uniref:Peptide/nickel transport system ATP-binding protein n=1 Tax=Flavimobilis soli TaxID=442709 RepID=A0A2A9ECX8_9MICO|nr:ABC transporter ATP-binding protein [Flavimobilis soli]PFG36788.1 peptide/nickel transport system ATP-binding protein [Flavimobilis soli]